MKQSVKSAKLQHFPLCCSKTAKKTKTIQEEVEEEDSDVEAVKVEGGALPHTHTLCMPHATDAADLASFQNHKQLFMPFFNHTIIIVKTVLIETHGDANGRFSQLILERPKTMVLY